MLRRGGGGIDGGRWGERRNKKGQGKASAVLALLLYSKACSNGSMGTAPHPTQWELGGIPFNGSPQSSPIYGGVETLLIYRVSFNSFYILITSFLHDINSV